MFDFEGEGEELGRPPPRAYAFTCDSPPRQAKFRPKGVKSNKVPRTRPKRGPPRGELGSLDSEEAAALEAQLGVAPAELPPHLRCYALQRRNAASFSGPGLLPGEQEAGGIEYKLRLMDPTPSRFQQLVTQLKWRLSEGAGECLYCLGVEDNGHPLGLVEGELQSSLEVLRGMAAEVGAAAEVLKTPPGSAEGRRCAVVRVALSGGPAPSYVDLRVAVAGGVDSGKSSLIGVLTGGAGGAPVLDNGRGSSRMQVFRHKHEIESGHTSSISLQQLAYDAEGGVLNYQGGLSSLDPAELAGGAARLLRFFDLGGHERFSKTALHGLTCMLPDYVMLCVNAVTGVSWVTREHLAVAIALGIPLFIALTKTDLASEAAVQQAAGEIRALLAAAVEHGGGTVKNPTALAPLVQTEAQAVQLAAGMHNSRVAAPGARLCVPLFPTSAVTGASLHLLHSFLNALQPADSGGGCSGAAAGVGAAAGAEGMQGWRPAQWAGTGAADDAQSRAEEEHPAHFQIDGSFEVSGVGTVYSGTVVSGALSTGNELLLGPAEGGSFRRVLVTGIHRSKVAVQSARQGQHATVAVRPLECAVATTPSADDGGEEAAGTAGLAGLVRADSAALVATTTAAAAALAHSPARAVSAGSLHAWMMQEQEQQQGEGRTRPRGLPAGTAAMAIQPGGLAGSRSGSQLAASLEGLSQQQQQQRQQQQLQGQQQQQQQQAAGLGELPHRWKSSPQLLASASSGPASRPRKGAVLLDPSLEPQTCCEFEAVLVLLGGHWPARGLLSGCYPPEGEFDEPDPLLLSPASRGGALGRSLGAASAASDSADGGLACGSMGGSLGGRSQSLGKKGGARRRGGALSYIPVVHCGSIRQAAQVVAMRELLLPRDSSGGSEDGGAGEGRADAGAGGDGWGSNAEDSGNLFDCLDDLGGEGPAGERLALSVGAVELAGASPSQQQQQQRQRQQQADEDEDLLSGLLLACDLSSEPSGCSSPALLFGASTGTGNGSGSGSGRASQPDMRRLAGAVAAAGVLQPHPQPGPAGSPPGVCSPLLPSSELSGSSGHASGGESAAPATPVGAAVAAAAAASPGRQLPTALERQRSLLGCQDIGCIATVTFRFMHNPEWMVEGARLIVRDRTTGRTSGAGYVTAAMRTPPVAATQ